LSAKLRILPETPALRLRSGLVAILLLLWGMVAIQPLMAQDAVSEEQLKAAFLYNFARFVEWPTNAFPSESTPIQLGVLGNDEFAERLAALLKEKKAHGRSLVVKKLNGVTDVAGSQIIFIAKSESRKTSQVADLTKKQPVLLVGESDDFLSNGGIINFVIESKQLRFDIHVTNAEANNLTISSHLLRLARNKKSEGSK
jgi:hypothetical protein